MPAIATHVTAAWSVCLSITLVRPHFVGQVTAADTALEVSSPDPDT